MKIGFNLLLWTTHLVEKDFYLLEKLKSAGYDGVEIPIFEGKVEHYKEIKNVLDVNGLECTGLSVIPDEDHNPISANENYRKNAEDFLKWSIDCCDALNSSILCGPFHQPLGQFSGNPPTQEEKERGAIVHQNSSDYAKKFNINLSIEPLNRFECYFLNTIEDTCRYVDLVDRENFGVLYDTFHSNIEEKDPVSSLIHNSKYINHIHISENDRGTPGKGNIPWNETFNAIKKIKYNGWLSIEAFGRALPDLAAATRVWRYFFVSEEEVYTEGFKLISSHLR